MGLLGRQNQLLSSWTELNPWDSQEKEKENHKKKRRNFFFYDI